MQNKFIILGKFSSGTTATTSFKTKLEAEKELQRLKADEARFAHDHLKSTRNKFERAAVEYSLIIN